MVEFRRSGPNGALLASEHGSPPLQGGPSLSLLALALSPPAAGGDSARASSLSPSAKLRLSCALMEWNQAVDILTSHVVQIRTPRGSGTGFLITRCNP